MEQATVHRDQADISQAASGDKGRNQRFIRVLVADDEEMVVDVLRALVGSDPSLRFVGAAHDAERAIDLVLEHQPDVVLLDVRMPGGGGLRATREISERSPSTKIIGLSAHRDADVVIGMIAAGAHGYVPKGDPTEKILRTIHRVAGGRLPKTGGGAHLALVSPEQPRRDERAATVARAILDGAVTVELQPIVDLDTMKPVGLNALPRLVTLPHRSYDAWCADARSVGLLADLELTAFREARLALRDVPDDVFLEIEVSPFTASEPRFRRSIQGSSTSRTVLAFSPLVAIGDTRIDDVDFAEILATMRARGVRVAVPDAGTGLQGLEHISTLAPDFVRLDTTLTRFVDDSFSSHAVVAAVVACATQVGGRVIAAGVETEEQLGEIRNLGIQLAQGPLLGEPMAISELRERFPASARSASSSAAREPMDARDVAPSHISPPGSGVP